MTKKFPYNSPENERSLSWHAVVRMILMLCVALVSRAHADEVAGSKPVLTACGSPPRMRLALPSNFEEVAVKQLGIVCVFRNKSEGFPTVTVTEEPLASITSLSNAVEQVESNYALLGITDAEVVESREARMSGSEAYLIALRYSTAGESMESFVMVIQQHDRTYTVTALVRASLDPARKKELREGLERLELVSSSGNQSAQRGGPRRYILVGGALVGLLLLLVVCRWMWRARPRRR